MNRPLFVVLTSLILGLASQSPNLAADVSAADWQKQSLKGITSIRYGAVSNSSHSLIDDVGSSLAGLKVTTKRIQNLKGDSSNPLSTSEARLNVIAEDRENNQCWVGLYVEQRCQLKRTPSINLESETYKIGKMCPNTQVETAVKDLCAEFTKDLSSAK